MPVANFTIITSAVNSCYIKEYRETFDMLSEMGIDIFRNISACPTKEHESWLLLVVDY